MAVELTAAAKGRYERLYRGELNQGLGSEQVTTLLERRAAKLLRLAMLFALTDRSREIDRQHVDAAWAWIRYWSDSVRFVFSRPEDEERAGRIANAADRVIDFLRSRDCATRTQLTVGCFGGHAKKGLVDAAIDQLLTAAPPKIRVDEVPRERGSPGAPTKVYSLTANSAKSANSVDSCGSAGNSASADSGEISECPPSVVRTVRTDRRLDNYPETRVNPHASHSSQSSQSDTELKVTVEEF